MFFPMACVLLGAPYPTPFFCILFRGLLGADGRPRAPALKEFSLGCLTTAVFYILRPQAFALVAGIDSAISWPLT